MSSIKSRKSDVKAAGRRPDVIKHSNKRGGRPGHETGEANKNTRDEQIEHIQGGGGGSKGGGGKQKG